MTGPDSEAWKETTSGRERVRMAVETLDQPTTVNEVATRADVAWDTANSELERMLAENTVQEYDIDGKTGYAPNPVEQFLDQILDLIEEHDRDELETRLIEHQSKLESLRAEYDVRSADGFRERIADEDLSADEMRTLRNAAETFEALEMERRLFKRALSLYEDVERLSEFDSDDGAVLA